jgi:hypothetical protein
MATADDADRVVIRYFVDEAGTPRLFGHRRVVVVGNEGVSQYFILGKLEVDDPTALARDLDALRATLLADPYFKDVPSMQREQKKTAVLFHAKDDLPEVRYQVLKLLGQHEVAFYAVVRDKRRVVEQVLARNRADETYWYKENDLYDELVRHLFKSRFYRGDHFEILFAKRGKSDRTSALRLALEQARQIYEQDWGVTSRTSVAIRAGLSRESAGLQAVDYFLWALQRLYEREEDRFWETVRPNVKLVYDVDDTRTASYGVYYTPERPLTLAARAKK